MDVEKEFIVKVKSILFDSSDVCFEWVFVIENKKDRMMGWECVDYLFNYVLERKFVVSEKELMMIGLCWGIGLVILEGFRFVM